MAGVIVGTLYSLLAGAAADFAFGSLYNFFTARILSAFPWAFDKSGLTDRGAVWLHILKIVLVSVVVVEADIP